MTIGGSRVAHEGDDVAILACGITVDQAVAAAEQLEGDGVSARVLDCYTIKPIDAEAVRAAARECGALVTVEDHWPEGGLGDAVLDALAEADERPPVHKLAVRDMPTSGKPTSSCTPRGSTPRRSWRLRGSWLGPAAPRRGELNCAGEAWVRTAAAVRDSRARGVWS